MANKVLLIIVIIAIVIGGIFLGLRLLTPEDTWLCQNGEWVKHGNPSQPQPITSCPGANLNILGQVKENIPEELLPYKDLLGEDLADFFNSWRKYEPDISLNSFTKLGEAREISGESYPYTQNTLREKIIGVFSPDQKKYVDPVIYTEVFFQEDGTIDFVSDIDNGVNLIDVEKKTIKNILSCGTPCGWYNAYWLTNSLFIVTGRSEAYPGGYDKCMNDNTCTEVITLDLFDLEKNRHYEFQSKGIEQAKYFVPENIEVSSDPYAEYRRKYEELLVQGVDLRPDVILDNLQMFQAIVSPLVITGQARGNWYFEASFPIKLLDESSKEMAITTAQAQSDWMIADYVPFKATLKFTNAKDQGGILVFMNDNPSGLPENQKEFKLPVNLKAEQMTIKVFFGNSKKNPNAMDCTLVYPVDRQITKTTATAKATLEELLLGPTDAEKDQGYFTSINPGVKIQKLSIVDGIAKVDFDETLEKAVGGSCRVAAIRSEITQTLKQFSSVKDIIISINGRTEDILQP